MLSKEEIEEYKQHIVRTNKDSTESEDEEQFFIGSIEVDLTFSEETKWCIDLDTAGTIIKYKIDSGAQANILPVKYYDKLSNSPKLDMQDKIICIQ